MEPFAEFSEECGAICFFQKHFCDKYIFRFKLPLQWDSKQREIVHPKRKYGQALDFIPVIIMTLGFIFCVIAYIELDNFSIGEGGRGQWLRMQMAAGCAIFTFGCGGCYYFICVGYRDDIKLGLNLLMKLYRLMEIEDIGEKKGSKKKKKKMKKCLICLILRSTIIFCVFFIPPWQPLIVLLDFDPVVHALSLIRRFVPVMFPESPNLLYKSSIILFRWISTLWVTLEGSRIAIATCIIIIFGLRMWIATLTKIRKRIEQDRGELSKQITRYHAIRILISILRDIQGQGTFCIISLMTIFCIMSNYSIITMVKGGSVPWLSFFVALYIGLMAETIFFFGLGMGATFAEESDAIMDSLTLHVVNKYSSNSAHKKFLRRLVAAVPPISFPVSIGEHNLFYCGPSIKTTIPLMILDNTINYVLS